MLCSGPTTAEAVGFPAAAPRARVRRLTTGRKPEGVAWLTRAPPQRLHAWDWLRLHRGGLGGIENGRHQRWEVSQDDDRCRVCHPNGRGVLGILPRLANRRFREWRSPQAKPQYLTTTDFHADRAAEGRRRARLRVMTQSPGFTRAPGTTLGPVEPSQAPPQRPSTRPEASRPSSAWARSSAGQRPIHRGPHRPAKAPPAGEPQRDGAGPPPQAPTLDAFAPILSPS